MRTKSGLCNSIYSEKNLSVLSLFDPGGIGKTTLVQYVYNNQEVQSHFHVKIWVCVSFSFNVSLLIQQIEKCIPKVDGENVGSAEDLIEQRLKSKRFLLVLDDMWKCDDEDMWKRLLVPFSKGQAKGNVVMVTTRFPALAQMVKTIDHPIELERLEDEEFMHLFEACVFGEAEAPWQDHSELLEPGKKIIGKLKGFPLAAKTVGRLLRNNLTLDHWRRVLASKEWELQTGHHDIMPALKLSYVYLPFHLQKCFSYCGLFPHDYEFDSGELIHLWMGLNILCYGGQNKTFEEIGLSYLNDLVDDGFMKKIEKDGRSCYVVPGLLQELARMVSSFECFTIDSHERSIEIPPDIRHLSIIVDGAEEDVSVNQTFSRDLINIMKRFKVENLHTLMISGQYYRSMANTFGNVFRKAKALCVLRLSTMYYPVEHMLHNFSTFIHLRYLKLGSEYDKRCPPRCISRFYKLIVLDLKDWKGNTDLPVDMSNLTRLRHFIVSRDEHHSKICEVGKLQVLQQLRRFEVKREKSGFELKQLGHLTQLSGSLSICNLEKIQLKEEADEMNLLSKNCLKKITLEWDVQRSNKVHDREQDVLNVLRPHDNLQELCIRGHGGHSCPPWLGSKLSVKNLQSLHLDAVDWDVFPPLGELWLPNEPGPEYLRSVREQSFQNLKTLELVGLIRLKKWVHNDTYLRFSFLETFIIRDCAELEELPVSQYAGQKFTRDVKINLFPKIQELKIADCPKLESVPLIPWSDTLRSVDMENVGSSLEKLVYSTKSSASKLVLEIKENHHLQCLDEMVAFHNLSKIHELEVSKGPPLMKKHLHGLTSLKTLKIIDSSNVLQLLGGPDDVKHPLPVERFEIENCSANGKELTQLLLQLPKLSFFSMSSCQNVTSLGVMEQLAAVDPTSVPSSSSNETGQQIQMEEVDDRGGLMLFPQHLSISLRELRITMNPGLSLMASLAPQNNSRPGGGLHNLHSLQEIFIRGCPKFLSAYSSSSSYCCPFPSTLDLLSIEDVEDMHTLAPLANLINLTYLFIENCGKDLRGEGILTLLTQGCLTCLCVYHSPNFFDNWVSWIPTESQQQKELPTYCKLEALLTDDIAGVLVAPICRFFSSSLAMLGLVRNKGIVRLTNEQEKAHEKLCFFRNEKLQSLPANLHGLHNLKIFEILECPATTSLPKNGFPNSLQKICVSRGCSEELEHQCILLEGVTINIE